MQQRTALYPEHQRLGARIVSFAGWDMPVQYPKGILAEHLATRGHAGMFDVSHMGRFEISGTQAVPFLERVLSNAASQLPVGMSHYTILPDPDGGAIDDAYLYHTHADTYVLVVNAANQTRDWEHLTTEQKAYQEAHLVDISDETSMISIQGPAAESLLGPLVNCLPPPRRNACTAATFQDMQIIVSRTGYAGEPIGFELIVPNPGAKPLWSALLQASAEPVGLGARDTLRLEATLPLYGHEFGTAPDGSRIPLFACPLARFAVALIPGRETVIGFASLQAQIAAAHASDAGNTPPSPNALPRRIRALALTGRGIARAGAEVRQGERPIGWVTSGTMVPYWSFVDGQPTVSEGRRALALALIDATCRVDDEVVIATPKRPIAARVVPRFLNNRTGPYAVPLLSTSTTTYSRPDGD